MVSDSIVRSKKQHQYFDKNGIEVKAGMILRHDDGEENEVYECGDEFGSSDLGFMASNPRFLEHHPDLPVEYYPLSQFNLAEWQIV